MFKRNKKYVSISLSFVSPLQILVATVNTCDGKELVAGRHPQVQWGGDVTVDLPITMGVAKFMLADGSVISLEASKLKEHAQGGTEISEQGKTGTAKLRCSAVPGTARQLHAQQFSFCLDSKETLLEVIRRIRLQY